MESLFLRVFIITAATTIGVLSGVIVIIGVFVFWQRKENKHERVN